MNISELRKGSIVDYHREPAEVLSFDEVSGLVELRKFNSDEHLSVVCDELVEDPQLHTDCKTYY